MVVCTNSMTEVTNELVQRTVKGATKGDFIFDICFSIKSQTEASMDVGADMISMVKTNT